jgi:hypothetical protein
MAYGIKAVGSSTAIADRLLRVKQRAAALFTAELRDCIRDSVGGRGLPTTPAVKFEQEQITEAIRVLCAPRPLQETVDERINRRDAQAHFGDVPQRAMLSDHLGLHR